MPYLPLSQYKKGEVQLLTRNQHSLFEKTASTQKFYDRNYAERVPDIVKTA